MKPVSGGRYNPPLSAASDGVQGRGVRLLLLGKGAVLARRFERPLAAELDDEEEPGDRHAFEERWAPLLAMKGAKTVSI